MSDAPDNINPDEAYKELSIRSRQLKADLVELAQKHYGDQYEDDGAFLFALTCDAVRATAHEYEGENGPLIELDGTPTADVLGPVVANVCKDWVIAADRNWRDADVLLIST